MIAPRPVGSAIVAGVFISGLAATLPAQAGHFNAELLPAVRRAALDQVRDHTLLTRTQVQSLMVRPNDPRIKIDSSVAARYLVVDFDPILPIAPGVVLIKAPGHTAGSQMVYVRLASEAEIIIAGDVAWNTRGIDSLAQKPDAATSSFGGEDKESIAKELRWLHDAAGPRMSILVSHDLERLDALVAQGRLKAGFDLTQP